MAGKIFVRKDLGVKPGTTPKPVSLDVTTPLTAKVEPLPIIPPPPTAIETPSFEELVTAKRAQFDVPTIEAPASLAETFAEVGPAQIAGRPAEFFQEQKEGLREQLRQEFFGPLGTAQQRASAEAAAGRLGSGVGQVVLEETVTRPFAQAFAQIERDVNLLQLEEQSRVEQFNAAQFNDYQNTLANLRSVDSANVLEAERANATIALQLDQLANQAAQAEAGLLSQEAMAEVEANLQVFETAVQDQQREAALALEQQRTEIERDLAERRLELDFITADIDLSGGDQQVTRDIGEGFIDLAAPPETRELVQIDPFELPREPLF